MGIARVASRAQLGLAAPRVEVEVHLGSGLPTFLHRRPAGHRGEGEQGSRARRARRTPASSSPPAASRSISRPRICPRKAAATTCPSRSASCSRRRRSSCRRSARRLRVLWRARPGRASSSPSGACCSRPRMRARDARRVVVPAANLAEARLAAPACARGAATLLGVCDCSRAGSAPVGALDAPAAAGRRHHRDRRTRSRRRARTGGRQARAAGRRRRRAQHPAGRAAGHRQEHARAAPAGPAAAARRRRSAGRRGHRVGEQRAASTPREYGRRPFRAPHHTRLRQRHHRRRPARAARAKSSLAHRGVLFLDELPEFNRARARSRCASRSKPASVAISRAALQVEYPARFQLVAAMNPCPVRLSRRYLRALPLRAAGNRALSRAHLRAAARSHRPARRGAGGAQRRVVRRGAPADDAMTSARGRERVRARARAAAARARASSMPT